MLDYFDSYTNIGYLMTDSSNVSGFIYNHLDSIEPFTNKNKKNKNSSS